MWFHTFQYYWYSHHSIISLYQSSFCILLADYKHKNVFSSYILHNTESIYSNKSLCVIFSLLSFEKDETNVTYRTTKLGKMPGSIPSFRQDFVGFITVRGYCSITRLFYHTMAIIPNCYSPFARILCSLYLERLKIVIPLEAGK